MKFKSKKICLSHNLLLAVVFKALLREQETKHAIEDAEIKGLELQAQKEMLQHVSVLSRAKSSQSFLRVTRLPHQTS